jgi:ubiquitin carboxyl-terminal hydrolase 36/42
MVQNIRNVGKQFRPMRQEDAHEYLRKLIDCMHEEILKQHGLKIQDGKITETTFIFRVFGGNLRNELLCTKCHYSSKTFNPFLDLSLEIAKGITSVNVAIKTFTQAEKLTVGNEWNCEGCKTKVQVFTSNLFYLSFYCYSQIYLESIGKKTTNSF